MKKIFLLLFTVIPFLSSKELVAQEVKKLTLSEVIQLAEEQSPQAFIAKHRFRSSYWQFRSYQAQFRPSLTLKGTVPNYSNGFNKEYNSNTDQYNYIPKNTISSNASLSLSQAIGLTGTTIFLQSSLNHMFDFGLDAHPVLGPDGKPISSPRSYNLTPVSINLSQPIRQYNTLRWQKKIEPVKYEAAKKTYLSNIEGVHTSAVNNFFALALAQINKEMAEMNYLNADTLYRMAQGRYNLGTIAEDELLQMKLTWLNSETSRKQADMNLRDREIRLRSFLGYNDNVRIELILPAKIPDLQLDVQEVLDLAKKNNPELITQRINVLNAQSNVAQAKASMGLNASLNASLGMSQRGADFMSTLENPNQSQSVNIGFTVPILDWGRGRGNYRMAKSSLELTQTQYNQAITDFEQNLFLDVEQFNLQKKQVEIAAESDTVAMKRYEVTKQRFFIGKIAVLDLNDADTRKDQNRQAYIRSLQDYWSFFYNIRSLALFDFLNKKPLEADYEKLLQ